MTRLVDPKTGVALRVVRVLAQTTHEAIVSTRDSIANAIVEPPTWSAIERWRVLAGRVGSLEKSTTGSHATATAMEFGDYHALVIGNQRYRHIPPLRTPIADAHAVAQALREQYGFRDVALLLDATRADIVQALDALRRRLTASDNLLIYYAGHGHLDRDADRGYWLPVDAEHENTSNWLASTDVTDRVRAIRAKHVLLVVDSCFSGTLLRDVSVGSSGPPDLVRLAAKRARTVITSGGVEPVFDSGGGAHSVFARAFLDALREGEAVVNATTLFTRIRQRVLWNAEQTPQYSDIRQAGHDGGDFIFVRAK